MIDTTKPTAKTATKPTRPFLPGSYAELYEHFGIPAHADFARQQIVRATFCGHAIECHRLVAPLFEAVSSRIHAEGLGSLVHTVDGCFVVRAIRGDTKPSIHSWGLALDVNAALHPLGSDRPQDPRLTKAFTDEGFFPGGLFHVRKDWMHYQWTRPHTI